MLKPPFDLEARPFRVGAPARVLDVVQEEAEVAVESLLSRAREEAVAILQEAEAQAAEVRERARQAGLEEGQARAVAIAETAIEERLRPVLDAIQAPLDELRNLGNRVSLIRDAYVLDLAATLAEQILGEALDDRERWIRRAVRLAEAFEERDGAVHLFVNRDMVQFAEEVKARLEEAGQKLQVLVDQHLKPEDLLLEGSAGGLDARVTESLRHIIQGVLHAEQDMDRGG